MTFDVWANAWVKDGAGRKGGQNLDRFWRVVLALANQDFKGYTCQLGLARRSPCDPMPEVPSGGGLQSPSCWGTEQQAGSNQNLMPKKSCSSWPKMVHREGVPSIGRRLDFSPVRCSRGEFSNQKLKDLCWEKNIILSFSPAHQPSSSGIAERMVGILKSSVRRMLKQAQLERELWSCAWRFEREKVLGRQWQYPLFGQPVDKAQAKSPED